MSAGWENAHGGTVIARHEFKGLSKLPGGLEDWVERQRQEESQNESNAPRRSARLRAAAQAREQHVPGSFYEIDDDEDSLF